MTHGQSHGQNWAPNEWYLKCGYNEYWHGYNQYNYGSVRTSLNGCGIGNVTFRNCGHQGSNHKVYVFLNGNKIAQTEDNNPTFQLFNFTDGSVLKIQEGDVATIQFMGLDILSCTKCTIN